MSDLGLKDIKYDCIHFKGGIPCKPSKTSGVSCPACHQYTPVSKRILIIKLGALGDVIRTTPLVVKFKKDDPNCHITWLTHSPDVLPANEIEEILKPDAFSIYTISKRQFDLAINLDKEEEACRLLADVSANEKYGYSWENGHISPATEAATHKLMTGFFDEISQKNTLSYLEEIFAICHMKFDYEPYLIRKNKELAHRWKVQLDGLAKGKKIVGLNTGCGPRWNTRLWPENYWESTAKELVAKGYFPVFLGGSLEHEKNVRLSEATGSYYPGHFSLEEFISLTDACEYIVTQVSMMMHIATALQKKLILMNNIFNKHEFELYNNGVIVEPKTTCVCYYGNTCTRGEQSCMHQLEVDQIINAVQLL